MESAQKEILSAAYLSDFFLHYWEYLTDSEKYHVCQKIDYSSVPERDILSLEKREFVRFDRITDKMQMIRLITRDISIVDLIDIKKFHYEIKEIFFFLKQFPELLLVLFDIDFENLPKEDALSLLNLGNYEIKEKLKNYNWSYIEIFQIIKSFSYNRNVIVELNYKTLKSYQISDILQNTGIVNADLWDLSILNSKDWLNILHVRADFIELCCFDSFIKEDPFDLITLIVLCPNIDFSHLFSKIKTSNITGYGWQLLLLADKFTEKCDFYKLEDSNWAEILKGSPELGKFRS